MGFPKFEIDSGLRHELRQELAREPPAIVAMLLLCLLFRSMRIGEISILIFLGSIYSKEITVLIFVENSNRSMSTLLGILRR